MGDTWPLSRDPEVLVSRAGGRGMLGRESRSTRVRFHEETEFGLSA